LEYREGLYYFNARWYDAELGRFTTEDPIRDGTNWYAYVGNRPLTYTDPTGLDPIEEAGQYPEHDQRVITELHPLNQLDFDSRYGFPVEGGSTQTCQTTSLINIYAAKTPGGVPIRILDTVVEQWVEDELIAGDGSPLELNKMSKELAKALGRQHYYSLVYPKPEKDLLVLSQDEFNESQYDAGIQTRETPAGSTHYTATVKKNGKALDMDSLDPKRPAAKKYVVKTVKPMQLLSIE